MPKQKHSTEEVGGAAGTPFELKFEDLPRVRDAMPGVRPLERKFEDLPRVRDAMPGVRPLERKFEDLPRVRDAKPGVRPFEAVANAPSVDPAKSC